jgi:predicted dehydrogenase
MTTSSINFVPSANPVKIGLVGTGNRGVNQIGKGLAARDDAELVALCDPNPVRLEAARDKLGTESTLYSSLEEMLRAEQLDGLAVTTPDYLHADHVICALENGVPHVFVDKPLATTAQDCLRVAQATARTGGEVSIGFNLRHVLILQTIKDLIDSGEIGELMMMENREFYNGGRSYMARWNRSYALSGGLWIHKGSHDFDVFNWLNPKGTPTRVSASAGINALRADKIPFEVDPQIPVGPNCATCAYNEICPDRVLPMGGPQLFNEATAQEDGYIQDLCVYLSDKDTHDNGIALVEYDNNVRASHMECFACGFGDRRYTFVGDRGTLMANFSDPYHIDIFPRWGEKSTRPVPAPPEGTHGGADPLLIENFVNSIKGVTQPSSGILDGVKAVAVGQAAEIASREDRTVAISELIDFNAI